MEKISIIVDGREFPTKTALGNFVRAILYKYKLYERLTYEDDRFMRALLERHPECEAKKAGLPIAHIEIGPNSYDTRSFFIVRSDGSADDFSFKKCI